MRLAICDDESSIIDILEEKLHKYFIPKNLEYDIRKYSRGEDLVKDDFSSIDLLFLDVEMPGLDGMETAKEIRKSDKDMKIVFLTGYSEFVFESFKVDAFRYLLKPLSDKELWETLDEVCKQKQDPEDYLTFRFQNEDYSIRYSDILYIEVMRDKIWIHCYENSYRWRGTMKEVVDRLEGKGFFQVHRSYLVNMEKIRSYTSKLIRLDNDCEVPMSKYRQDAFKEEYLRHWSKIL